mgnify:CR=1 FL=1
MRLAYWYAKSKDGILPELRAKTRATLVDMIRSKGDDLYSKPKKVVVEYRDGFHLLEMCLSRERAFWGMVL